MAVCFKMLFILVLFFSVSAPATIQDPLLKDIWKEPVRLENLIANRDKLNNQTSSELKKFRAIRNPSDQQVKQLLFLMATMTLQATFSGGPAEAQALKNWQEFSKMLSLGQLRQRNIQIISHPLSFYIGQIKEKIPFDKWAGFVLRFFSFLPTTDARYYTPTLNFNRCEALVFFAQFKDGNQCLSDFYKVRAPAVPLKQTVAFLRTQLEIAFATKDLDGAKRVARFLSKMPIDNAEEEGDLRQVQILRLLNKLKEADEGVDQLLKSSSSAEHHRLKSPIWLEKARILWRLNQISKSNEFFDKISSRTDFREDKRFQGIFYEAKSKVSITQKDYPEALKNLENIPEPSVSRSLSSSVFRDASQCLIFKITKTGAFDKCQKKAKEYSTIFSTLKNTDWYILGLIEIMQLSTIKNLDKRDLDLLIAFRDRVKRQRYEMEPILGLIEDAIKLDTSVRKSH